MKLLGALTDQGETTFFECESILSVVSLCATGGQIVHKNFSPTV